MGWRRLIFVSLTLGLVACGIGGGRDDDDDDDDDAADLTPLEWSMVGVWRGSRPNDRWHYMVFNADRTGCEWTREGDDFARRFDEIQFRNWALDADALDEDMRMPLSFVGGSSAEVYDSDRYDVANDRILPSNQTEIPAYWQSIRIDCDDSGTDAIETDVDRWGSMGNGYVGQGDPSGTGGTSTRPGPGTGGTTGGTTGGGPTGGGPTGGTTGGTTGGGPTGPTVPGTTDTGADTGVTDTGGSTGPTGPQPP